MKENVYVKGTCPHCGAKIPSYVENKWLYGIVDAVRAKLGLKAKKMEELRKESVERLSDKNYAHELAARGLYVPEEYL